MSYQALAFFMGLFGSFHCAAMCGPLVLALPPAAHRSGMTVFVGKLLYQIGRIATYAVLGLLAGLIGNAVSFNGWQQGVSLFTGLLLVVLGCFNLFGRRFPGLLKRQQTLVTPLVRAMGHWLYRPGGNFFAGVLHGFLPCGMVYMALAAALNADTVWSGGAFMLLFGAGTAPVMLAVAFSGDFIKRRLRFNVARWLPVFFLVMGGWFLLRGANLDISYLSPLLYPEGAMTCR